MKIVDIKVFPTWVGSRNQMVVKVETDEGIHGWGEAGVSGLDVAQHRTVEEVLRLRRVRQAEDEEVELRRELHEALARVDALDPSDGAIGA